MWSMGVPWWEFVLRGVVVQDGQVDEALLRRELISPSDLAAALRMGGCLHTHEVERATLETNGTITVVLKKR